MYRPVTCGNQTRNFLFGFTSATIHTHATAYILFDFSTGTVRTVRNFMTCVTWLRMHVIKLNVYTHTLTHTYTHSHTNNTAHIA